MDPTNVSARPGEELYLASYRLEDHDRPSVCSDVAVFALQTRSGSSYRSDPELSLSLLLIRRGVHPYRDMWALPGGFLHMDETVEECAFRELSQETGLVPAAMFPVGEFSAVDRDPRGRILSFAYGAVIGQPDAGIRGGDDAAEARWFRVGYTTDGGHRLTLTGGDTVLTATLEPEVSRCGIPRFRQTDGQGLAFDHSQIILTALTILRQRAARFEMIFDFLPERFTLSEVQRVQDALLGTTQLAAGFRRKVAPYVEETDCFTEGAGHRPARLFKRRAQS